MHNFGPHTPTSIIICKKLGKVLIFTFGTNLHIEAKREINATAHISHTPLSEWRTRSSRIQTIRTRTEGLIAALQPLYIYIYSGVVSRRLGCAELNAVKRVPPLYMHRETAPLREAEADHEALLLQPLLLPQNFLPPANARGIWSAKKAAPTMGERSYTWSDFFMMPTSYSRDIPTTLQLYI